LFCPIVVTLIGAVIALSIGVAGCSSGSRPDPKDAVKAMFDAMRTSDSVTLASVVDLSAASHDLRSELAGAAGDTAANQEWDKLLLKEMTGEGVIRQRWLNDNQVVLGRSEVTGDSALVEVSFLDRVTRVQYYNKMRLHFRDGHWVVTDFRTM
jgi:outer membrane murein-binding lipoprotein Lpp